MKIFNILMSRKQGGERQAALDYYQALLSEGHLVINITSSFPRGGGLNIPSIKLPNLFPWCIISKIYLKILIFFYKPDLIIAHGGRAVNFSCAFRRPVPVIGITHSYSVRHILKCDYIIALHEDLKNHMIKSGYDNHRIFIVPNMINIQPLESEETSPKKSYFVIGYLGRFVPEKGVGYLIEAVSILKNQKYRVRLMLGGTGTLEEQLKNLVFKLGLEQEVRFAGWVKDKKAFFNDIDLFCIPSVLEPFGIVALEGMSYKKPIVATDTYSFVQIFESGIDALIARRSSAPELAASIARLINSPRLRAQLASAAFRKVVASYDMKVVAPQLSKVLNDIPILWKKRP